jgi:hypothetical protein
MYFLIKIFNSALHKNSITKANSFYWSFFCNSYSYLAATEVWCAVSAATEKSAAFDLLYSIASMKQVINTTILKNVGLMCKPFFIIVDFKC